MSLWTPRQWSDGEEPENIPTADDLNTEWRDSFDFLLGNSRPIIILSSTSGQSLSSTEVAITWNSETLKRGGMIHSTSSSSENIQVPYDGWYQGYVMAGWGAVSTLTTKLTWRLKNNGNIVALMHSPAITTSETQFVGSFTTYAVSGDIYTVTFGMTSATTGTAGTTGTTKPRMAMWFSGDG